MTIDQQFRDDFYRGTLEAALWADLWDADGELVEDGRGREDDVDPETAEALRAECDEFVTDNADDLTLYVEQCITTDGDTAAAWAGHDFHLTRGGHGTGFWDRGMGDLGKRLSDACEPYGEFTLVLGANGKIDSL